MQPDIVLMDVRLGPGIDGLEATRRITALGLPSIHYTVTQAENGFVFSGGGWGHNVGMSQWGAYSMARFHGMSYTQILQFYFTGTSISTLD